MTDLSTRAVLSLATAVSLGSYLTAAGEEGEEQWGNWRGADHAGVAAAAAPTTWSDEDNIAWRSAIPGRGLSTPIVWGDQLFLTSAVSTGKPASEEGEAPRERGGGRRGRGGPFGGFGAISEQEFVVLCLERATGSEVWRKTARVATPHEAYHRTYGSWASASPVTDGERLIVSFGTQGVYCYDLEGEHSWTWEPGVQLRMRNQFGEGAAPVLYEDTVVHGFDHEGDSFAVALDASSGKERWRVERNEPSVWSMPLVVEHEDGPRVVFSGSEAVRAYALDDGELLWECGGLGLNAIPSLVQHDDLLLAMSGYRGAMLMAIRLGGEGDLTDKGAVAWESERGCAYTASPVLHEGKYYVVTDRGLISCFDAGTGEAHYLETRLPRGSTLKASPIAAGEFLYVATESGDVHVIRLGEKYEHVVTNSLEEQMFVASPIVVDGALFLRGESELICIAEPAAERDS